VKKLSERPPPPTVKEPRRAEASTENEDAYFLSLKLFWSQSRANNCEDTQRDAKLKRQNAKVKRRSTRLLQKPLKGAYSLITFLYPTAGAVG
jgi:hypothetical protein